MKRFWEDEICYAKCLALQCVSSGKAPYLPVDPKDWPN